jgi:lysophospholipase L1-like esterase
MKKGLIFSSAFLFATPWSFIKADAPASPDLRETIEWIDYWDPQANNKSDLPRVLLIGDSITRGYYDAVAKNLQGKAVVIRLANSQWISDPMLLAEIAVVLDNNKFDIIHFNNGMHGWQHSEDEYKAAFPAYLATIQKHAPNAKLIWATTTPITQPNKPTQIDPRTERVKVRNSIAHDFITQAGIPEDDIFTAILPHPEFHDMGGIHYLPEGREFEGKEVAEQIEKLLPAH